MPNETESPPLLRIRNLHYDTATRPLFRGINIDIPQGAVVAIMGPSGSGKTTLLKLISAQLRPQQGRVEYQGQNIHQMSRSALYKWRRQVGFLFQSGALLNDLNVFDNVAFPLREHTPLPAILIRHLVLGYLQAVGLRGARQLWPTELSGGMARRVALARALVLSPMLMLYDEPFTGQDPISMGVLVRLLKTVNQTLGITSVIVSHDLPQTLAISDHVYLIAEGQVVAQGSSAQIGTTNEPQAQQFLHGKADGPIPFDYPAAPYRDDLFASGDR